ncbi:MAG: formate dehydrogenase accessory sulfurtransferase FdhD [Candidatus Binatia bacterium]|nr:formate dehydrogenase accessory sulfurtransferase FdhD [Candidatus Binatia bacterium]
MSAVADRSGVARRGVVRWTGDRADATEDRVAVEEPLEIRIGDAPLAVTMRTPGEDQELAAGFCLTEGIVGSADDLASLRPCDLAEYGNVVEVTLSDRAATANADRVQRARREFYVSSSCGLCGKQTIDRLEQSVDRLAPGPEVTVDWLSELPGRMRASQDVFAETGGLHAAAIFEAQGDLRVLREDVGRHNAVDKAIGHELLLGRTPASRAVLLVSGRASFEIVQKAAMAGLPVLCAVSAPSSLAIDLAARLDLTLVGFLRSGRMNVYHDPGRIRAAAA